MDHVVAQVAEERRMKEDVEPGHPHRVAADLLHRHIRHAAQKAEADACRDEADREHDAVGMPFQRRGQQPAEEQERDDAREGDAALVPGEKLAAAVVGNDVGEPGQHAARGDAAQKIVDERKEEHEHDPRGPVDRLGQERNDGHADDQQAAGAPAAEDKAPVADLLDEACGGHLQDVQQRRERKGDRDDGSRGVEMLEEEQHRRPENNNPRRRVEDVEDVDVADAWRHRLLGRLVRVSHGQPGSTRPA